MKRETHLTLFIAVLFSFSINSNAQQKIFPTSYTVSSNGHVDSQPNAIDENFTSAARVNASSGLAFGTGAYSGHIELSFATTLPANTVSYIKINTQENILGTLIGGSLGELLSDVAGGLLLGDQRFTVQAKNGSNVVLEGKSETDGAFSGDRLNIIVNEEGDFFIKITPSQEYNRIRITNRLSAALGLFNTRWLDVYEAFYVSGSAACGIGTYASYSSSGLSVDLLELGNSGVSNPHYAIDDDITNYSELNIGILGVAASVEESIHFEGPSLTDDRYTVKLKIDPTLVAVGVLNNIAIKAYRGSVLVQSANLNSLLSVDLLGLIQDDQPVSVPFYPGAAADKITVSLSTLASVAVTQNLRLYGIVKGDFDVSVDGSGNCQVDEYRQLTAQVNGCNAPYTYAWSGDISAATSQITPSTEVPGEYNYTVTVTDKYGIQQRSFGVLDVEVPPLAGIVSGTADICSGSVPEELTLTGYLGDILRWEISADEDFTNPQIIDNTGAVLNAEAIGAVTATTYYRAVIKNNSYPEVHSTPAALTVKNTTWNGTEWSNGIPDLATTIYMTGDYNSTADLYGCSLEVSNNAEVIIPDGTNVTLTREIKVLSGSFTLKHNANLIQIENDAVNIGNINVQRNSSLLYRLDYTLWSSPVTGVQMLAEFSPQTHSSRFYHYNTLTDEYDTVQPDETTFEAGKGVLIRMPNGNPEPGYNAGATAIVYNAEFTGVPNNGEYSIPLSVEGNRNNAVGNPYPSPINVHDFFDANQDVIDSGAPLYFWRKKNNANASSYATLTKGAFVANEATGGNDGEDNYGGIVWESLFNTLLPSNWVINPGQGFFVRANETGGNVVFNNDMRRAVNNNQFFRQAGQEEEGSLSRYWINFTNSTGNFAQTAVVYSNEATNGIDYGWDGRRLSVNEFTVYSIAENESLAIQARAPFTNQDVVKLGYYAVTDGTYTISLHRKDGLFEAGQAIYIKDNATGVQHNLHEGDYTFVSYAGIHNDRLEIIYQNETLGTYNPQEAKTNVTAYKSGDEIIVTSAGSQITGIKVYDISGRKLHSVNNTNTEEVVIKNLQSAKQVLLLTIATTHGEVSKKIVF